MEITINPSMNHRIKKFTNQILLKTLISCPVPEIHENMVPTAVSVIGTRYEEPTNHLKVIYDTPR